MRVGSVLSLGILMAGDGDTALIGARYDDTAGGVTAGSVYAFVRSGNQWIQHAKLTAPQTDDVDQFGFSVALDGDTSVVGARLAETDGGRAYVFVRQGTSWAEQAALEPPGGAAVDRIGVAVSVSADTAVVGAPGDDITPAGTDAGSAWVFVRAGSTWAEQATLTAPDAAPFDHFGSSVSVDGDLVVGGTLRADRPSATDAGSASVFVRSGAEWSAQARLIDPNGATGDQLGSSVALSGGTAVVGSPGADVPTGADVGSAHVFVRSGSDWLHQAELMTADGSGGDRFGSSVALRNDVAMVGSPGDDTPAGADAGTAHVFLRSGSTWTERATLPAPDGAAADSFAASVAVSEATVVVGSPYDDTQVGPNAGSIYVAWRSAQGSDEGQVAPPGSLAWNSLGDGSGRSKRC